MHANGFHAHRSAPEVPFSNKQTTKDRFRGVHPFRHAWGCHVSFITRFSSCRACAVSETLPHKFQVCTTQISLSHRTVRTFKSPYEELWQRKVGTLNLYCD